MQPKVNDFKCETWSMYNLDDNIDTSIYGPQQTSLIAHTWFIQVFA
jgi:hypothetical protein